MVEKHLVNPTFIYDFPAEVSPLAKRKVGDSRFAERFELFIGGLEIANAYSELNDPKEQKKCFEQLFFFLVHFGQNGTTSHAWHGKFSRALETFVGGNNKFRTTSFT